MDERRQSSDHSSSQSQSALYSDVDDDELLCSVTLSNLCSVVVDEPKSDLKEFILLFETLPSLWNPNDKNYLNTVKKNEDLEKLVEVYKKIKPNAKKDDVRKKINSLRSNYRKELKKIENSRRSGIGGDEIYKPTSATFHLLQFLMKIEKPKLKKENDSSEVKSEEDNSLVISSITNEHPPVKTRRTSGTLAKQNELLNKACSLLSQPSASSQQAINPLALVWSDKLKMLNPTQKLYAEKAINDILFEAELNNLHRHSVQINSSATHSSPASSTPYPYTPSPASPAHESENLRPNNLLNKPIILKKPLSTNTRLLNYHQTSKKVQSGPASQIFLRVNSDTTSNSNSDEYTVGSLFASFKPT